MRRRWNAITSLTVILLAVTPGAVEAETSRRVALWPTGHVDEAQLEEIRARVEQLGEVIDLPSPAPPGPTAEEQALRAQASARIDEAQARYYEASFEEAVALLESFFNERAESLATEGCLDSLRHLLIWLGATQAKIGRLDEAVAQFALAQTLGQEEIDRALFPPEVTAAFDQAREQLASAPLRLLWITEVSEDSRLLSYEIDGSPARERIELVEGRHVIVGHRPGYRSLARIITVAGERTDITLELPRADEELLFHQIAVLRREGELDPSRHRALVAEALSVELVAIVDESGDGHLLDASGAEVPLPEQLSTELAEEETTTPEPALDIPVWRRWWFWASLVGGAAILATGVGLGAYYGTGSHRTTFTLIPGDESASR